MNEQTMKQELTELESRLAELRAKYQQLERDVQALQARKRLLIHALEGQLDLFRDHVHHSELLLEEVRHG
ncbi:hypothetical protein [Halomonas elongata]|uniref:Uncharacterized protein n=1 Tax=Halomonas elongata (strain ATCC 33173 / DSM 2581 / NBRC 15536 / NCIMB 2198 / 1H9) TaxID=768066 RepID=E1VA23_HALED|nr:hypothetical protein [Halomonas elongata]WBF17648.1 hypothetical protein LM502_16465 [Halomonas elongata]WPU46487.1 hypothetical protein SR933_14695 [Halomonas elongata DSM 2581]CBV43911.1 uncharacterized protein HELO_4027 [Halomonas elongata DSM 2581]